MDLAFYTGVSGADASMKKLSVVSNNLANINNNGFKPSRVNFGELIDYNLNAAIDEETNLKTEVGVKVFETRTDFSVAAFRETGKETDYALGEKNAFFCIKKPGEDEVLYSRNGNFHKGLIGDEVYLLNDDNYFVLDKDGNPITISQDEEKLSNRMLVKKFDHISHLKHKGNNLFSSNEVGEAIEKPNIVNGYVEGSGTDMANEAVKMIEAQRAYSYALKIVQVSDEITGSINNLRS